MSEAQTAQAPVPFRRIVGASLVGTSIEWYDFFLYGSAVTIVFDRVFFPESERTVAILLGFLTYALGFLARPLGGLVFGHYGDRLGRKKLLIISLLMMGGATFLMGLLPTFAAIGIAAPLLLTLLRLVQGFAVGGEWGGAVLLVSEHGGPERRGFWASMPQAGVPIGNLLATAVLAVLAAVQTDAAFISWGWRIPFLLSAVLVVIGLWMRLAVSETPAFQEAAARAAERGQELRERAPILAVLRQQWRSVLTAVGARFAENVVYYVITTFVLVYVVSAGGVDKTVGLNAIVLASFVHLIAIPCWGALSDKVGRRPVYLLGAVGTGLWTFAFFPLVATGDLGATTLAVAVGLIFHGAMYGPQAAYFSELFATRVRYSGASIGYQGASIFAGALAPLIATALYSAFGSSVPISLYVLATAIVTVVTVAISEETRGRDLQTYDSAAEPVTEGAR